MAAAEASGRLWMWGLIATIVTLMLFFVGFAIWTFQDDVELVYDNYYDKDMVFEQQIRRVERTEALTNKPSIKYEQDTQIVLIEFPAQLGHKNPVGEILMFRPADLHKDRIFSLQLQGDTLQSIGVPDLDKGLWRAKLSWKSGGLEYYQEQMFMVN
ncbi:MAG: FixH family protein [Candidatus Marinimicrobia bacterium]|nr:FixH family protein [Candidatus Neomarinimicrobiota bacterium]